MKPSSLPKSANALQNGRSATTLPHLAQPAKAAKRVFRDPKRPYAPRKAHLYAQYARIIGSPVPLPSTSEGGIQPSSESTATPASTTPNAAQPSIIFVSHENFSVAAFTKLRGEVIKAVNKVQTARDRLTLPSSPPPLSAKFQILRPGLFVPVVRSTSGKREARKLDKILRGPIATLVLEGPLDPPLLQALLRVIDKAAPPPPPGSANSKKVTSTEDEFEPKAKPVPVPKMRMVGAYVDGKVFKEDEVREWTALPRLDELRAQIIGLVGAPAVKLSSVLANAAGGHLALTLEGWKRGLEEEQSPS